MFHFPAALMYALPLYAVALSAPRRNGEPVAGLPFAPIHAEAAALERHGLKRRPDLMNQSTPVHRTPGRAAASMVDHVAFALGRAGRSLIAAGDGLRIKAHGWSSIFDAPEYDAEPSGKCPSIYDGALPCDLPPHPSTHRHGHIVSVTDGRIDEVISWTDGAVA
jgi:hypothetical protein